LIQKKILKIKDLSVVINNNILLDNISISIFENEVLGIIGESGSGKTITALSILRLLHNKAKVSGSIVFNDYDLLQCSDSKIKSIRGNEISIIFQDPQSSFNPLISIGEQISETIHFNNGIPWKESKEKAIDLLRQVEIKNPALRYKDFPHHFSGGMLQRAMIAIAISSSPRILIADEPTTALDRIVERKIIELLLRLKNKYKFSLILISHDLRLVSNYSDRIAIFNKGRIVEKGKTIDIITCPTDSYSKSLFSFSRIMNNKFNK